MFYSHEMLTRREHGVATIWLVATLGSKSSLKKVTRKAINDVDVPKAVQTIVSPDAPMALRLQGNLLYGVSRVYSQQCSYVHSDLQNFWDKLRHSSLVFGTEGIEIDPEAGRAKPDQLNLQDDPAFLPDFNISLDLSFFDLPRERSFSRGFSHLPSLADSSRASLSDHEPQLELPSDDTPGLGIGGFELGSRTSSVGRLGSNVGAHSIFEEPGIIDDPEFDIDADGNLFTPTQRQQQSDIVQAAFSLGVLGSKYGNSTGITDQVRAEHEAGLQGQIHDQAFDVDDQGVFMGDDDPPLPGAPPFSACHAPSPPPPSPPPPRQSSSAHPEEVSSVINVATQRRVRPKPAIKIDQVTQLHNNILKEWEAGYLRNMAFERQKYEIFTSSLHQSKKNAEHLVLSIGLSGLGREFDTALEHPLRQAFSGQALFGLLTGRDSSPAGKKRGHEDDENADKDEDGRRVRPRSDDDQEIARGEDGQFQFDDADGIFAQDDDPPIELGRNAPPSIPDIDSIRNSMPWNILSSRAGSARPPGVGLTSSTGAIAGGGFEPARHLTSASPLFGRGKQGQGTTRYSSLEIPGPAHTSGELGAFNDESFQLPNIEDEEFELHGPAAGVSTQQADNSQWLANTLEDEANNFFAFLQAEIQQLEGGELKDGHGHGHGDQKGVVKFEELLPPDRNSAVVAAQGLLHVLTLATTGAVMVVQEEDFGEIEIGIVPGVRLVEVEQREEEIEGMDLDDVAGGEGVPEDGTAEDVEDNTEGDEDMYG